MKDASQTVVDLLADGGYSRRWVADLMYDGDRRLADVPLAEGSVELSWDADRFVAGSGSVTVAWSDDAGASVVPSQISDWFAPFGSELQIDCVISAGEFQERVSIGRFMISQVPDAVSRSMLWEGRPIVAGESFGLALSEGLARVQRDEFPFPTRPGSSSVWGEIQSLTGLPVVRNVPDKTVPTATAYDGNVADAVSSLFDTLGAWPHLDAGGVLTARPKTWPAPVGSLGGHVSEGRTLTNERTYNRVVVEGKSPAGEQLFGIAEVTDGPLRVRNADGSAAPYGTVTYRYASDKLTTRSMCIDYAQQLLPRVSRLRGVMKEIVEPFNPLREIGDVLTDPAGGVVRVQRVTHSGSETRLVVEVPDA